MNEKVNWRIIKNVIRIAEEKGIRRVDIDLNFNIRINQLKHEQSYPTIKKLIEWSNTLGVDIEEIFKNNNFSESE